jgi:ribosomal protein S18 acetylase RimI-like enzyme
MLEIRPARPEEAGYLTALAIRSKAHWGYDVAFPEACRESLVVTPEDCDGTSLLVAVDGDQIAGFAQLQGSPPVRELDDLWVDPGAMGRGVGRALFDAITALDRVAGYRSLTVDSDPHAESFYSRMGMTRIGETQFTVDPSRYLPVSGSISSQGVDTRAPGNTAEPKGVGSDTCTRISVSHPDRTSS